MFVDDLFNKKTLTESSGGGSPWHSEPEQQQMDADRRGRLDRERNAGLGEPDDAPSGSAPTGNGVYEYTVPAGQESVAQELGLQQHRGHWVSRVPIQRANFQFGRPQFHEIPSQGVAEGSEQVYRVLAVDKSNALSKQVKLKVKASSLDEVFERLAINDWYPLEINGVEVINGKRLKQGVAEGLGKTIKRGMAGWGAFDKDKPADVVKRVKGQDTDTLKGLSNRGSTGKGSPAELQQKAISRELKKRGEQGVAEGMLDNPGEQDSPVEQAIIRRILMQRTDLLSKYGPEKVGQAVDEVADFVGDVDEIGSSDVSGWVRHVEQMLGNMTEGVAEGSEQIDELSPATLTSYKNKARAQVRASPGATNYNAPTTPKIANRARGAVKADNRLHGFGPVKKSTQDVAEGKKHRINEAVLMEDPVYRKFKGVGRYIAERRMSEKEILQVFADAEAGMTDKGTGANRTMLGRGKDNTMAFAGSVKDAVTSVLSSIQNSVPVSAVDVAYDQATDALAGLSGGQRGKVMQAIKGYRNLVKEYPKASGFAKAALVAIAGLATGGAGLPAIAGLTYALDSAIRGDKLSSVLGKGVGASAVTWGGQQAVGALTGPTAAGGTVPADQSLAPGETVVGPDNQINVPDKYADGLSKFDQIVSNAVDYKVKPGDTLSEILADRKINPEAFKRLPGNEVFFSPDGNPNILKAGQTIKLPDPADVADLNRMSYTTPSNYERFDKEYDTTGYTGQYNQNSAFGLDAANNLKQQGFGRLGADDGIAAARVAKDAGGQAANLGPTNLGPNFDPDNIPPGWTMKKAPSPMKESIKFKILPVDRLIDRQGTIMSWALQESIGVKRKSVNLTTTGAYTVFENVDRYRQAIMEKAGVPGSTRPAYYRPDMSGGPGKKSKPGIVGRGLNWLDRTAGKVGGALSNFGHQFTTNVTKEKLKMNWHQAGKPSDSDQLAAFLTKQGVPQEVVSTVYGKMSIPYTAPVVEPKAQPATEPAATGKSGIQTGATALIDPDTERPYEKDKLAAMYGYKEPAAPTTAAAKTPAASTTPAVAANPAGFNAGNVMKLPGMEKYAKPAAPAKTANFAGPSGYGKTTTSFKPPAAPSSPALAVPKAPAAPTAPKVTAGGPTPAEKAKLDKRIAAAAAAPAVAETIAQVERMLESVNSKKSAEMVRAYVDQKFTELGLRNTTECRNIMAHVVQESAIRRRQYAKSLAK